MTEYTDMRARRVAAEKAVDKALQEHNCTLGIQEQRLVDGRVVQRSIVVIALPPANGEDCADAPIGGKVEAVPFHPV